MPEPLPNPHVELNNARNLSREGESFAPFFKYLEGKSSAELANLAGLKQDPNKQQHHTYGSSKAATCLKKEIDNGKKYKAAIRILNEGMEMATALIYAQRFCNKQTWLLMLRREIIARINNCGADDIIKSLCRNVFTAKYRFALNVIKGLEKIDTKGFCKPPKK